MYLSLYIYINLSLYIYVYMCTHVCIYTYTHIYIDNDCSQAPEWDVCGGMEGNEMNKIK